MKASRSSLFALALAACGPSGPAPIQPIVAERPQSTLTQATQDLLWDLRFPVIIHAYLTEPTPPALTPAVASIKELVAKYGAYNGSKITVDVIDPYDSDDVEKYARERFQVEPELVKNVLPATVEHMTVYFAIVIEMGRQVSVLQRSDLIDLDAEGQAITSSLRDVEALITDRIRTAQDERTTW